MALILYNKFAILIQKLIGTMTGSSRLLIDYRELLVGGK